MPYYIGLMSGTSADGIDASLVGFSPEMQPAEHYFLEFSAQLKQQIVSLYQATDNEIIRTGLLANQLAHLYAKAVKALLAKSNIDSSQVNAIGCHGQTIRHCVDLSSPFSVQICNYALLAELTGIDVIGDFRSADIAAGGQGAPLVPAFHQQILPPANQPQVLLNIGGIANLSLFDENGKLLGAYDTGPGNALLDDWINLQQQKAYDKNGEWAAQGRVSEQLLQKLLNDPYFAKAPPKSTGREYFNLAWLQTKLANFDIEAVDVQRSLLQFTCVTIAQEIATKIKHGNVWVCGGGAHNKALLASLQQALSDDFTIASSAAVKIDPDWVESQCFAWLAYCFREKITANLPQVTGARKTKVLGCLYPA
ncbi:anhydro-N-acetylmuramic acid kinase [Catenovulum sediminis]|uniref:anhydro-N-acetylmuramic acid kinase n=1 Tax=Catenovulum sediminis TaxID=1740262 RepID=UPI00117D2DFC|nr:anhydro-N-acetylmuramic acid kinase [Catenovulum sediminis]